MTVEELTKRFPQDILTALSDDLGIGMPNEELIQMYIEDGERYINSVAENLTQEEKDILIPTYVVQRLYERLGYTEKAEAYRTQLENDILLLVKKAIGEERSGKIAYSSKEQLLKDLGE